MRFAGCIFCLIFFFCTMQDDRSFAGTASSGIGFRRYDPVSRDRKPVAAEAFALSRPDHLFPSDQGASRHTDGAQPSMLARLWQAEFLKTNKKFTEAIHILIPMRETAIRLNDRKLTAMVCGLLGDIYNATWNRQKALDYCREALACDTSLPYVLTKVYLTMGNIYTDAGNYTKGADYYNRCLKTDEKQHDTLAIIVVYCNLAGVYEAIGNISKGIEYDEKALELARITGSVKDQGYCLNGLGSKWFSLNNYNKAFFNFRQALKIHLLLKDWQSVAFQYTNIGDIFLRTGQTDSAQANYAKALKYSDLAGGRISRCCVLSSMGKLAIKRKNYTEAIDLLNRSLAISNEIHYKTCQEDIYSLLSAIYDSLGRRREALVYLQKRNAIHDSAITVRVQNYVADLMISYEVAKDENRIRILDEQVSGKNRSFLTVVNILIGVTVLVVAVLTGIYLIYRKRLKPKVASYFYIREKIREASVRDSRQMQALKNILPPEMDPHPELSVRTSPGTKDELIKSLEFRMQEDRLFLQEDLSLAEVARILNTNTSYLSRQINEHFHENFNAYVNRHRVEEAKRLIGENRQSRLSYEGIARSAGFRSKSTFHKAFKEATGLTPGGYAEKLTEGRVTPEA